MHEGVNGPCTGAAHHADFGSSTGNGAKARPRTLQAMYKKVALSYAAGGRHATNRSSRSACRADPQEQIEPTCRHMQEESRCLV